MYTENEIQRLLESIKMDQEKHVHEEETPLKLSIAVSNPAIPILALKSPVGIFIEFQPEDSSDPLAQGEEK